jgi:putative transposase
MCRFDPYLRIPQGLGRHYIRGRKVARQLRIEYPGAFYHITSRGNQKQPVFLSPWDKARFLDQIKEVHEKYDFRIHAYCLMENHYHLMLETRQPNLSRGMHFLNTAYSVYFNNRHKRVGHLFQGRFKGILIEAETYAQELSRYIHLNPVRAGISRSPESYPWSSFREYLGKRKPPAWLETQIVLSFFGKDPEISRRDYMAYVIAPLPKPRPGPLPEENGSISGVLGSPAFLTKIKESFLSGKAPDRELPALNRIPGKPSLDDIHAAIVAKRGKDDIISRNTAIAFAHHHSGYTLKEIGKTFGLSVSAISMICQRAKQERQGSNLHIAHRIPFKGDV